MANNYPPLQAPFIDERTGKVSRPWAQYFQNLDVIQTVTTPDVGSDLTLLGLDNHKPIPVTLGAGMVSTGSVLSVDPLAAKPEAFYYEPETNQSTTAPALVYHDGDVTMLRVRIAGVP